MKKLLLSSLILGIILGFSGCDDVPKESPVKIDTEILSDYWGKQRYEIPQITITAVDDVTIEKIIVNEGNGCPVSRSKPNLPTDLKYGDRVVQIYTMRCNIIKIEVQTNKGDWVVEY